MGEAAWSRRWRSGADRGSASVLMVGAISAVVVLGSGALVIAGAAEASNRARAAADLGALAGAQAQLSPLAGSPCGEADRVARINGARTIACTTDGPNVVLRVAVPTGLGQAVAVARAGPAGMAQPG